MAWLLDHATDTDEGRLFEFHGSLADPEGRPFEVVSVLAPDLETAEDLVAKHGEGTKLPQRRFHRRPRAVDLTSQPEDHLNARS